MSDEAERKVILDRLAELDLSTLSRLATLAGASPDNPGDSGSGYLAYLKAVADSDVLGLTRSEASYGNSWKQRGGVDTYHMMKRKWERVENRVAHSVAPSPSLPGASAYDIFEHIAADPRSDGFIDDIRDLRRYLMLGEAEMAARSAGADDRGYLRELRGIADADTANIEEKEKSYGSSWKRSGGIGAFMMFARKWDRIKQRVGASIDPSAETPGAARENVLEHIAADRRSEPILDDIRDLRRYLLLVEAEMAARGGVVVGTARDDRG